MKTCKNRRIVLSLQSISIILTMNRKELKYNSLNLRGISKNTPPSYQPIADNKEQARGVKSSLLHRALAPCSRAFLCLMLFVLPLVYASCEKEHLPERPDSTRTANDSTSEEASINITITINPAWGSDTTIYI